MAKMMKAAVVHELGKPLSIDEVPVPEPKPGQILVKIHACGVCGTDLHASRGDWQGVPMLPFIPGHEGAGYVAAVGAGVTFIKEGDRVGIPWLHSACGHCTYCWSGWETLCKAQQNSGYSVNGAFAEYAIADPNYVGLIPPKSDFLQIAPILCAGVTTYKGLKMTEAQPGDWVAISGIGGLGHLAVQYAKAMGLHVAAIDVEDRKLDLAKRLGADIVVNGRNVDPASYLRKEIGGAHGVLVTATSTKAFEQAIGMVRRKGTIVFNGLPPGSIPVPIVELVLKGVTLRGSIVGTRVDLQEALAFAGAGAVTANVEKARLEDVNQVFERMHAGQIDGRVVLDFVN